MRGARASGDHPCKTRCGKPEREQRQPRGQHLRAKFAKVPTLDKGELELDGELNEKAGQRQRGVALSNPGLLSSSEPRQAHGEGSGAKCSAKGAAPSGARRACPHANYSAAPHPSGHNVPEDFGEMVLCGVVAKIESDGSEAPSA